MVGSVGVAFTYFCGPAAGKLCERFGSRAVTIFGTVILMTGFVASSQSPNIIVLFFCYSIVSAFGTCCIYTSVFLIVPVYFNKQRFLATGMIAAGPGAGVFMMTPIIQACLNVMSWRSTLLVLVGCIFPICLVACSFDPDVESDSQKTNEEEDCHRSASRMLEDERPLPLWRNPTWVICTLATAVLSFGVPIPSVHMVSVDDDDDDDGGGRDGDGEGCVVVVVVVALVVLAVCWWWLW
jgi:MFS family permease